jgi:hypothetical protein
MSINSSISFISLEGRKGNCSISLDVVVIKGE